MINRKERLQKLNDALVALKEKFVGLDSIIDEIGNSISPWYITPEVIDRPVVISLWGMTGTGKSSLVKELLRLLEIDKRSITIDCGEYVDNNKSISDDVNETFPIDRMSKDREKDYNTSGIVFTFDEFQYANTIDEVGKEVDRPSIRPIWSLIDTGILTLTSDYEYVVEKLNTIIDIMSGFVIHNPEIVVTGNVITESEAAKAYKNEVLVIDENSDDNPIPLNTQNNSSNSKKKKKEKEKSVKIIPDDLLQSIFRTVKKRLGDEDCKEVIKLNNQTLKLGEYFEILKKLQTKFNTPTELDCRDSLIFIIGNLDEAFYVSSDLNPDIDADMFNDITSEVSINDIKTALRRRFRPEQIARFGNNIIKYPTLRKDHFIKVINKEVSKIINNFRKISSINLSIGPGIINLLYSEGVFPVQGVRPVLSTIGTILTPYLSKIVLEAKEDDTEVLIDTEQTNFKVPKCTITLTFNHSGTRSYEHYLTLGYSRDPEKRKKRYICAVHELGHAVLYSYCTGKLPKDIVAVSVDHGGFCTTYDRERDIEISSKIEIENDIMVSYGGYLAEHLFFPSELCLMGSSSDIDSLWESICNNTLYCGFIDPIPFQNHDTQGGYYGGFDVKGEGIEKKMLEILKKLKEKANKILLEEKTLIKEAALYLGKVGSMTGEEFLEYIKNYGKILTPEHMKNVENKLDPTNYLKTLRND